MSTPTKALIWMGSAFLVIVLVAVAWYAPWWWCQGSFVGGTEYECTQMWGRDPFGGPLTEQFWKRLFTFRL